MRTNRKINPDVGCLSAQSMPICKLKTCLLLVFWLLPLLPKSLVLHNRTFYIKEPVAVYLLYQFTVYASTYSVRHVCFLISKHMTNHFNVFSASSICEYVIYSMTGRWRRTVTVQEVRFAHRDVSLWLVYHSKWMWLFWISPDAVPAFFIGGLSVFIYTYIYFPFDCNVWKRLTSFSCYRLEECFFFVCFFCIGMS